MVPLCIPVMAIADGEVCLKSKDHPNPFKVGYVVLNTSYSAQVVLFKVCRAKDGRACISDWKRNILNELLEV